MLRPDQLLLIAGPALLLLLFQTPQAPGDGARQPPTDRAQVQPIARLIGQLGSVKFAQREEATRVLDAIGEPALDALRAAADGSKDVETRRRARALVEIIEDRNFTAAAFARKMMIFIRHVHESSVVDVSRKQLTGWAIEELYREVGEKVPPRIAERLERAKELQEDEVKALLRDARVPLDRHAELFDGKDVDRAVAAMLARLDPHAEWVDHERPPTSCGQVFVGIGLRLEIDIWTRQPRVVTPIKDSPAYRAGIQTGDLITQITRLVGAEGLPLLEPEAIVTQGLPLDRVNREILGRNGTPLRLTIRRTGVERLLEFDVERDGVRKEVVFGCRRKKDDSWDYLLDPKDRIGYVRLPYFVYDTSRDLTGAIDELTRQGLQGLILDLRGNPGGLIQSAIKVADQFIDDGTIVAIRSRGGKPSVYSGEREGSRLDFPMVCLIDRDTASSSEIMAACLQDHKRAVIVGERSQGKGSVQSIQPLLEQRELKLTLAVFLRPSGRKLDRIRLPGHEEDEWGVVPDKDFALEPPADERAALLDHLNRLDILPRRDQRAEEGPVFRDRQCELALKHIRSQLRRQ